jgi:hypothetical protein
MLRLIWAPDFIPSIYSREIKQDISLVWVQTDQSIADLHAHVLATFKAPSSFFFLFVLFFILFFFSLLSV